MLISYAKLLRLRILSLQVGGPIAEIKRIIIDPNELKVIAFELSGPAIGGDTGSILDARSIREVSNLGIIIDSSEELVEPEDVIKIGEIIKLNFELIGMKVVTRKKTKLGKVSGCTLNSDNLMIQQLIVQRPVVKAFLDPELTIGRSEIVEVTDYEVIVKDEEKTIKAKSAEAEDFIPNFVNPFREPGFAKADSQSPGE